VDHPVAFVYPLIPSPPPKKNTNVNKEEEELEES